MKPYNKLIEKNYGGLIDKIYVIHLEWFFKLMFSLAKVFLKKETTKKFVFLDKPEDLNQYFDKDYLLKEYGGT